MFFEKNFKKNFWVLGAWCVVCGAWGESMDHAEKRRRGEEVKEKLELGVGKMVLQLPH